MEKGRKLGKLWMTTTEIFKKFDFSKIFSKKCEKFKFRLKSQIHSKTAKLQKFCKIFVILATPQMSTITNPKKFAKMKRKIKICCFLTIFSALIRFPCLFGDFVFDDRPAIVNNQDVFNVNSSWTQIFNHDFWGAKLVSKTSHKSYRPLTTLSFRINGFLLPKPQAFHLINVLIHSANCVLAFLWISRFCKVGFAFLTSLIFACHPLHTEAVCGIVGRADLLWTFFALFALLQTSNYSVILLSILSVLSKEQGILVIPLVISLKMVSKKYQNLREFSKDILILGPMCAMILYLRLKIMNFEPPTFQEGDNPTGFMNSKILKTLNFQYINALNFWLMILPHWLCYDWAMGCIPLIEDYNDVRILAILVLWIVIFALSFRREFKALILLILPYLPSSNLLVLVGFVIAERNLYLSVLGYSLILATGYRKVSKMYPKTKWIIYAVMFFFICKSVTRSFEWQTEEKLFTSGLKVCENNAKIHYNMAKIQRDANQAEKYYRKALQLWPNYEHALNNLGNLIKTKGDFQEAEKLFEKALKISPKFAACWMNLGIVQTSLNKYKEAEMSYVKALELKNPYPDCHFNLGTLYLKLKQNSQALQEFEICIEQNPKHFAAYANIVLLYDEVKRFDLAEQKAREAIGNIQF